MPRPVVALPCGSRSARRVGRPARARPAARLTAVVVLPTPPFWLTTASVLRRSFSDVSRQTDSDRQHVAVGTFDKHYAADVCSVKVVVAARGATKLAPMFHVKHRGTTVRRQGRTRAVKLRDR